MGRKRNPERDLTKQRYIDSGGTMKLKELAALAKVSTRQVQTWKKEDNWNESLPPKAKTEKPGKKRGGQHGNKNAAGNGAPPGNKNAETHGAYNHVDIKDLPPAAQAYIEGMTPDAHATMYRVLKALWVKEADLQGRIEKLKEGGANALYVERVIEMYVPAKKTAPGGEDDEHTEDGGRMVTAMRTVIRASAFELITKLEGELDKTHGRIIKLTDTMSGYERDRGRIALDKKKHEFAKQKAIGEFSINPETGEIVDEPENGETLV